VGELTSRLSADVTQIQETLRTTIAEFFRQIIIVVGGIFFLLFISWKLSLIMLATVPVMAIIAVFFGRYIRRLSKEAQDFTAESNSIVEEALTGITNVKAFTNEYFALSRFKNSTQKTRDLNVKSGVWRGLFVSFIIFCLFGAIVFIIWQGMLMTQGKNPELSSEGFYQFVLFTIMMGASVGSLPDLYASIQKSIGATENLMNIINEKTEKAENTGISKATIQGDIEFKNVSFAYPQRKDMTILNNVSFGIEKNKTLALVGPSGSGKSTIANLLMRMYDADNGQILLDGKPIGRLDIQHFRQQIGFVPQEVFLFSETIYNNIAFGITEAAPGKVEMAAKNAAVFENIMEFGKGFQTLIGERGITLSGGQKQRLSIARAIIKEPQILIFDDCLSAVDTKTEEEILSNLSNLMKNKTSILIAHRISTIKNADRILVMDNGEIVEHRRHFIVVYERFGEYSLEQQTT
jgi:ABC-type multidrug transport system fused ATPase/permease subunit